MDQREVETMIKSLQKALADKDGVTDIITIMEKLKKEVVPTEDLLRVCSLIRQALQWRLAHSLWLHLACQLLCHG
jgi:hypothetical protein